MKRRGIRTTITLLAVLAIALSSQGWAFAQGPSPQLTATALTPESTITATFAKAGMVNKATGEVSVVVKLRGKPLAAYDGSIAGLKATSPGVTGATKLDVSSPDSQAYLKHLAKGHDDFETAVKKALPNARVTHKYDVLLNAVSLIVPGDQVGKIAQLPGVEAVYPDQLLHLDTDNSPQFIGAPSLWTAEGGQEMAGEDVIVGVLDAGIWPEHPSFSDPDPSGKAYAPPATAPSGLPRACDFSGGSNPGAPFTCNNKLIGAQRFMATYDAQIGLVTGEFTTARDDDGHGTHTSSTAAGNAGVAATIFGIPRGTVSGVAPRAYVMMYKVCGESGCFSSDSAAAVQQAIKDGVDVINFSISGGSNPFSDPVELAFLDAYDAGIFVAASAGNSGPAADTTDHRGPWVTTVAASTQNRAFQNTLTLTGDGGASLTMHGASLTGGVGSAPVFVPSGSAAAVRCDNPLAAGSVTGKIVVCQRGNTGRVQKGFNVLQGGAVGMILYNQSTAVTDVETDNHFLPATHIQFVDGTALLSFFGSHTNVAATLSQGVKVGAQGDVMASFSSRGGPGQTLGVSKPDITAPGVQVLAGSSPEHVAIAVGPQGELFQAIAGTSMSSPHIAGAAALLKAHRPYRTPGQIKSSLMTTAKTSVVKEDGVTPANAFDDGSGRVNLTRAGFPGLTFDETAIGYLNHQKDLWNANYPSVYVPEMPGEITVQRTAHSNLSYASSWALTVVGKSASDFAVSVPSTLTVGSMMDAAFSIAIDAKDVSVGQVRMATVVLTERNVAAFGPGQFRTLHIPVTFVRKMPAVSVTKVCDPATFPVWHTTDCKITVQNNSFDSAFFSLTDKLPAILRVSGSVVNGLRSVDHTKVTARGTLPPALPPNVSIAAGASPAGYLPLSAFGVTPIAGVGDETITNFNVPAFTYGGQTYTRIGMVSDGYLVVGGGTGADIQFINQSLPDQAPPNNVLAPFWTDLNPGAGGAMRVATLTDGTKSWIVFEWTAVKEFSTPATDTFQVWISFATNNDNGVSFTYGPVGGNGDGGFLTVGAENQFGNRGGNYYFNGAGTLPTPATKLVVASTPMVPQSRTTSFKAIGIATGSWVNYAELTSNLFQGIGISRFAGKVTR